MGEFAYKAVDRGGMHVSGTIQASDRRRAVAALAEQGRFATEIAEKTRSPVASKPVATAGQAPRMSLLPRRRVPSKEILAMTTQLSTALRAGLPLLNCLELIRKQQKKPASRRLFDNLVHSVSSGKALSEALAEHDGTFNPLYLSMVRVGETGGILEQTTQQLAGILDREEKIKTNMKNASAYPLFVLFIGIVSVIIIVTWILPRILATFGEGLAVLPLPTRIMMSISDVTRELFTTVPGWIGVGAVVAGVLYLRRWRNTTGRLQWDALKLRIPVLGSVLRTISVGRFARTLGALTQGGVTILEALGVVRDTLGNEVLAREIDEVAAKVKRGESLADPLDASGLFPPLLVQIVSIGEQTGKLDELLLNAANTFDTEADAAITRFMAIFPAFLILLLAVIVGFIIASALLPIVTVGVGAGLG